MSVLSRLRPAPTAAVPVDLAAVHEALGTVIDPELHLPLPEAGMLGNVEAGGRSGTVKVTVRLTTPACPMKDTLGRDVTEAVSGVTGVTRVEVSFAAMTENERMHLAQRLRADNPDGAGHPFRDGSPTTVYAVASGKGGVGKSTVTANLAVALARQGKRVGVLDADVWGYSIPHLFGVRRAPVAIKGLMLPIEAHGVALMSVGFFVSDDEPVLWRGPMLHKALEQFLGDVHWGRLDVLLIDLPPGTGDITMSLLELVPDAALIAVTTPQPAAQTVAERVGRMARNARMPVAGIIENMSGSVFGSGGGDRLARAIDAPLLGRVPLDERLREGGDAGVPLVLSAGDSVAAAVLLEVASRLPVVRRSIVGRSLPLSVV